MLYVTRNERDFLEFLAARPQQAFTPAQMIRDIPAVFGKRSEQGLHATAASLVRKNLIYRDTTGGYGYICYQIRPEVLPELRTGT